MCRSVSGCIKSDSAGAGGSCGAAGGGGGCRAVEGVAVVAVEEVVVAVEEEVVVVEDDEDVKGPDYIEYAQYVNIRIETLILYIFPW